MTHAHVFIVCTWLKTTEGNLCLLKIITHHLWWSHDSYAVAVPCYTRSHNFLTCFLTHFQHSNLLIAHRSPRFTTAKTIHGKEESLAILPNNLSFTGYEPNDLIEVGFKERMPLFFQQRTSSASTWVRTPLQPSLTRRLMTHNCGNAGFTTVHTEERGKC